MRRTLWILLTPLVAGLVIWLGTDYLLVPALTRWAKAKVEALGDDPNFPAKITVAEWEAQLFPPRMRLAHVSVAPRGALKNILKQAELDRADITVSPFDLLFGRSQLVKVRVMDLLVDLNIDPLMESEGPAKPLPLDEVLKWSDRLPFAFVALEHARIKLASAKLKVAGELEIDQTVLSQISRGLRLSLLSRRVHVDGYDKLDFGISAGAELTAKELRLGHFDLKKDDLTVHLEGVAKEPAMLPVRPQLTLSAETQIPLDRLAEEIQFIEPSLKLPPLAGMLKAQTRIEMKGSSEFTNAIRVQTQSVKFGKFEIGDATVEGAISPQALTINSVSLNHPAGAAKLGQVKIEFKKPYSFQTQIDLKNLDLQALFQSLNLKKIPVDLDVHGQVPCQGSIDPFAVSCAGKMNGNRLLVRTDNHTKAPTVVELVNMEVNGEVAVNLEEVRYKSDLTVDGSHGSSDGVISFEKGFKINYKTPMMDFKSVKNLANLKFEGTAAIEGSTEGNSDTASFDMKIATKNFVFENYTLDEVSADLQLQKGHLIFQDLVQRIGRSKAVGSLDVDLVHDTLAGEFSSESLEAEDLVNIFHRIWPFPLTINTRGHAQMHFDGPLDFWKMNYELKAFMGPGRLHSDSFDSVLLNASAVKGNMQIENAVVKKGASIVRAMGGISHDQILNIKVEANNLRLENSEMINKAQSNLSGALNVSADITGPTRKPEVAVRGSVSDMYVDETEIPSSFFNLNFKRDHFEAQGTLFGNKIQADLQVPYDTHTLPLKVRMKTADWAFTNLLLLAGANNLQSSYESSLTSDLALQSDSGDWNQLNGHVSIKNIFLKRAEAQLKNPQPIEIDVKNGVFNLQNALLVGPQDTRIEVRGEGFRLNHLNVGVKANTSLRLLQMFTPFLEDLGGNFRMEASLGGRIDKPEILGNANVRDGFFKLKGFPHSIERLRTNILFSQNRVVLQNIQGNMASGTIRGEGSILLNKYGDIPMQIRIQGQDLSLNVPDKVRSNGDADLLFSGKWFPYTLSGRYNVTSALVEKEFTEGGEGTTSRTNNYLPKILKQAQFDPVLLDINLALNQNIMVKNSMMDGQVSGHLQVKGPPQNPVLLGRIITEKGSKIILKDKTFDLLAGTVNFTNTEEVNPELYLSAQARINEYDVNVLVQGYAKNPTIRMTSVPPLPEQDIVSLLALGITSQRMEGQYESQQRDQLRYEAIGVGLSRTGANKFFEKATGFNVAITSSYDQTKNISVPKITFTRKLSDRLNATYARPINDVGNAQEFKLQYVINNNWSMIGSYEERESTGTSTLNEVNSTKANIFGLDLEFKREFK